MIYSFSPLALEKNQKEKKENVLSDVNTKDKDEGDHDLDNNGKRLS